MESYDYVITKYKYIESKTYDNCVLRRHEMKAEERKLPENANKDEYFGVVMQCKSEEGKSVIIKRYPDENEVKIYNLNLMDSRHFYRELLGFETFNEF